MPVGEVGPLWSWLVALVVVLLLTLASVTGLAILGYRLITGSSRGRRKKQLLEAADPNRPGVTLGDDTLPGRRDRVGEWLANFTLTKAISTVLVVAFLVVVLGRLREAFSGLSTEFGTATPWWFIPAIAIQLLLFFGLVYLVYTVQGTIRERLGRRRR